MPKAEIRRRGGATRVRTQRLSGGRYRHIYVVREPGPRGGHTVAGEVHQGQGVSAHPSSSKGDKQPSYKIKPRNPKKEVERAQRRRGS